MPARIKHAVLVACLFVFLFVVIGAGLHLNPGGAFLAAATGTPLVVHFFNRRCLAREFERDPSPASRSPGFARSVAEPEASASEAPTALRQ